MRRLSGRQLPALGLAGCAVAAVVLGQLALEVTG